MEVENTINCPIKQVADKKTEKRLSFEFDLETIAEQEGFVTYDIVTKKIAADGGNFLANLYQVSIKGKDQDGPKELNLFIKHRLDAEILTLSTETAYNSETLAYRELFPAFRELENEYNIPENDRFKTVKYLNTKSKDVIIMEDMAKEGYNVFDRFKSPSLRYAETAIDELAKFHSLSFAIEKHRPDFYENVLMKMKSPYVFNEHFINFLKKSMDQCIDAIKSADNRMKLERVAYDLMQDFQRHYGKNENYVNTLCHNDIKVNNFLTKEQDGNMLQILVDFQLLEMGTPLRDFFYFILPSTDQKFRRQNLEYLKDYYYKALTKYLNNFELDINDIYLRSEFENDYRKLLIDFGLIVGLTILPFILAPEDDFPDFSTQQLTEITFSKHDLYVERLNELVEDFVEWGSL